jgi:O-antigen/teichoic acid export membrane protein
MSAPPPATATPAPAPRLAAGAVFLVGGRLTTAACTLVQIPLVLAALGPERFGLWVVAVSLLWTLASLDGGLGFALQNRLATHLALGRPADAVALAARGRRWLWLFVTAIGLLAAALSTAFDPTVALGLGDLPRAEVAPALALAAAAGLASIPLGLAVRIAFAA